ncbi:MAG TPA: sodium-independent anion transporter, partial [Tichowtungia sp.]|nr:sodium-independent anion transporter [Tichowtungia sp.]
RFIGIDAKGINSIDATGVDLISALVPELRRNGVELIFCGLKPAVLGLLERGGVIAEIGEQNLYPHLNAVQKGFFSRADATG